MRWCRSRYAVTRRQGSVLKDSHGSRGLDNYSASGYRLHSRCCRSSVAVGRSVVVEAEQSRQNRHCLTCWCQPAKNCFSAPFHVSVQSSNVKCACCLSKSAELDLPEVVRNFWPEYDDFSSIDITAASSRVQNQYSNRFVTQGTSF